MPGQLVPPSGGGGVSQAELEAAVATAVDGLSDVYLRSDGRLGASLAKHGVVLSPGSGTWDGDDVESPTILRDPKSGRYAMVYTGYGTTTGALRAGVGLAWSDDLLTWTKQGSAPILPHSGSAGAPDQNGCTGPLLLWDDENETYVLYYIGLTATGYEGGTKRLCRATSTSLTGPWTRHGAVISPSGSGWRSTSIWHPSVVERDGTWYLFFNANGAAESIGYATATSINGPWTVDDANSPVLSAGTGWESSFVGDPSVRRVGDLWVMDYFGYNGTNACDGIAVTSDHDFPLGWVRHPANPILDPGPDSFDAKFAHKPFTFVNGGDILHYYTAVDAGDVRRIGLAVAGSVGPASLSFAPTVTGDIADGTALQSLLSSLSALGLDVSLNGVTAFVDDFNRANGALGSEWQAAGGSGFAIANNECAWTGTSDGAVMHNSGLNDGYAIQYTVREVNGGYPLGFVIRATAVSATNFIKVYRQNVTNDWRLNVDGGTATASGSGTPAPVAGDVIRVEVNAGVVTVLHNGTQRAQWTNVTSYSAGTYQGIVGSANLALRLDDFIIEEL